VIGGNVNDAATIARRCRSSPALATIPRANVRRTAAFGR
jgi:hypothetical protein